MILFKKAIALSHKLDKVRTEGKTVGFVPTMGALHKGHEALLRICKKECDVAVCSIFVNPMQFNNAADFTLYPNTIEQDMERLLASGCDLLFLPRKDEIYPEGYAAKKYDLGYLETILEGKYRPGHFQGVCQAVDRLLSVVNPQTLYLGQKDYQQCMIIKKLLALTGRENITVKIVPTEREESGLAMSSRNLRLTPEQRDKAVAIYKTLTFLKAHISKKSIADLLKEGMGFLKSSGFDVDYIAIADAGDLSAVKEIKNKKVVALIAATIGNIRLIDNMLLN